jgi:hypothetical protein
MRRGNEATMKRGVYATDKAQNGANNEARNETRLPEAG